MAKKGEKNHLKRINAPKVRKTARKGDTWSVTTSPGPHEAEKSIPLAVALRENLGLAQTLKEARKILGKGNISVDGKIRKNPNFPLGFMDVLNVEKADQTWRVLYDDKGYLVLNKVDDEEDFKLGKVLDKHPYKGGKYQLSLHDGKSIIGDFEDIEVGETVRLTLPDLELSDSFSCEEGNKVLIIGGTNVGKVGEIEEVFGGEGPSPTQVEISSNGEKFQSPEKYVFVIGEDSSVISLEEGS